MGCDAISTPEWRRGPMGEGHHPTTSVLLQSLNLLVIGPRTLCNACGLVYAKLVRPLEILLHRKLPIWDDTDQETREGGYACVQW